MKFLRWRKHKPGLEVLSYTFKGHIDHNSTHSRLLIRNVTIEMHGQYKCSVRTDLGAHESERQLVVVSPGQCKASDWRVTSDQAGCSELIRLDCRQLFPRPVSSCGLWDAKLDKFIQSVALDISEDPPAWALAEPSSSSSPSGARGQNHFNGTKTYRIKYADRFELLLPDGRVNPQRQELLQYAGHLIFKCDILIPDTSWRMSLAHKMFDFSDGCNQAPLEAVERMRARVGQRALLQLQQMYSKSRHQFDEIEMPATNLRFELLPAAAEHQVASQQADSKYQLVAGGPPGGQLNRSTRKSLAVAQQGVKPMALNCWQRPRYGARVRLSCAQPADKRQVVRLSGASQLECRPSGWVPVGGAALPAASLNEIGADQRPPKKAAAAAMASLRTARRLDLGQSSSARLAAGGGLNVSGQTSENESENDDDDASWRPASTTANEATNKPDAGDEHDEEHEHMDTVAELTPAELAALLPKCVAISNAPARRTGVGRLHLLNGAPGGGAGEAPAVLRESRARPKGQGQEELFWFRWLKSFSSAGAPSALHALGSQTTILATLSAAATTGLLAWTSLVEARPR